MSDRIFVDTNILVYAHDRSAGSKHSRAKAAIESLWSSGVGVLSVQVLQELCVVLGRKIHPSLNPTQLRNLVTDYSRWDVVPNTPQSVLEALEIMERHQLSFWDAMILQAAEASGATVLFSEDFSSGQTYGTIRIENPLAP